ncbi:putative ABC transporter permease subunit [Candidatus Formimonas warabiya]|uniref:Uncharacterized protein n=1 Tax=Formimonas warabiya TaxID=1761012 RepID=A0A3G1KLW9_FORW1|nr:hypothetical protein [Candidatus Formimonas warabiya]ATW23420.1 hypothetical protein DCMF_00175 [Candidatus Formimonas warabiya]
MNKLLVLTKVLLRNSLDSFGKVPKTKKQLGKTIFLAVLLFLAFSPMVAGFGYLIARSYDALAAIGQAGVLLHLSLSVVSMIIFVFGLFYVISIFYFSKDIENLLPLPFRPWQILGAKFLVTLCYEYFTELIFLAPVFIAFGLKSGAGILYYLYGLILFLTLPMIPLCLASMIMMVLMRFTGLVKNKDRFRMIAGIGGLLFGLGINIFFQKFAGTAFQGEQLVKLIMEGNNSLLKLSFGIFPQTRLGALALVSGGWEGLMDLFWFLLITAFGIALFSFLGEALYFKGVMGVSETAARRKVLDDQGLAKATVPGSVIKSYTLKELRVLFRTPVYFMNCVLMNFIWPVFLLIPFFAQPNLRHQLSQVEGLINHPERMGFVLTGVFALSAFVTASNLITPTALSREGGNIFVAKYLPVSYKKQLLAKVLAGVVMGLVGTCMMLLVGAVLIHPPGYLLILSLLSGLWGVLFSALSGMVLDVHFPKLHWDNEQKAVKQNMNGIISILISAVCASLTVFGAVKLHLGLWSAFLAIMIVFGVINGLLYLYLSTRGVKLFSALEK